MPCNHLGVEMTVILRSMELEGDIITSNIYQAGALAFQEDGIKCVTFILTDELKNQLISSVKSPSQFTKYGNVVWCYNVSFDLRDLSDGELALEIVAVPLNDRHASKTISHTLYLDRSGKLQQ